MLGLTIVSSFEGLFLESFSPRFEDRKWLSLEHLMPDSLEPFLMPVIDLSEAMEASEDDLVLGVWILFFSVTVSEFTELVREEDITWSGDEVALSSEDDSDKNSVKLIISNCSELVSEQLASEQRLLEAVSLNMMSWYMISGSVRNSRRVSSWLNPVSSWLNPDVRMDVRELRRTGCNGIGIK